MSVSSDGAVQSHHDRAHLQRIPPEIRNQILSLVLVEEEDIEIEKHHWPAVLRICNQLREEGLPVFLGNNNFIAMLRSEALQYPLKCIPKEESFIIVSMSIDQSALTGWLRLLSSLPSGVKASIKNVAVRYQGDVMDFRVDRDIGGRERWSLEPNFTFWNQLIVDLKSAGLRARQLVWPGSTKHETAWPGYSGHSLQLYFVSKHILAPLLDDQDMLDNNRSPMAVVKHLKEGREREGSVDREVALRFDADFSESQRPGTWFAEWKAARLAQSTIN